MNVTIVKLILDRNNGRPYNSLQCDWYLGGSTTNKYVLNIFSIKNVVDISSIVSDCADTCVAMMDLY